MDHSLIDAIHDAWAKLAPRLAADPDLLASRLARRRKALMLRPPRAWCLAVRASDTRITPMRFACIPDHIVWWDRRRHRWQHVEHTVELEARNLRWLCRPVNLPSPHGLDWREAATLLGVDRMAIRAAINRGVFSVRHVPHLGGKKGPPIPIVSTRRLLDPASFPLGNMPGPEWGTVWRYLSDHIPPDLSQTLTRRPVFRPFRGQHKFRGWRWICPGCAREVLRVFYPLPAPPLALPPVSLHPRPGTPASAVGSASAHAADAVGCASAHAADAVDGMLVVGPAD